MRQSTEGFSKNHHIVIWLIFELFLLFSTRWVESKKHKIFITIGISLYFIHTKKFYEINKRLNSPISNWESLLGSVIQATGDMEYEDGLRTGALLVGCWCQCGDYIEPRINSNTIFRSRLVLEAVQLSYGPLPDQSPT